MDKELRRFLSDIEVRASNEDNKKTIGGYACKYNSPTLITDRYGDQFLEEIAVGAFDESLQTKSQKALWNHNTSAPLGSVKSGTLRFNADSAGLNYDVDVPNNTWGNDAYESIQRGDVDGSSFGFYCLENIWSKVVYEGIEMFKRTITKGELLEVSPCTFPAYESSEISCRSFEKAKEEARDSGYDIEKNKLKLILELEEMI